MKWKILIILSLLAGPALAQEMTPEREKEMQVALAKCKNEARVSAGPRPVRINTAGMQPFEAGMASGEYHRSVREWNQLKVDILVECMEAKGFHRTN